MRIIRAARKLRSTVGIFQPALFCLIFLCILCGKTLSQDWQTLKAGVEYAEVTREISGLKVNMNLLRLDLTKVRLDVVHAFDKAIGVDTTSNIAMTHKAFAAINAGFFRLDKSEFAGDPAGIFISKGKTLSEDEKGRIALLIFNTHYACTECEPSRSLTSVSFEYLHTLRSAHLGKPYHEEDFPLDGFNRERKENEAICYTPEFGPTTPQSASRIVEVVFQYEGIKKWTQTNGQTPIPKKGFVVSFSIARSVEVNAALKKKKSGFVLSDPYILTGDLGTPGFLGSSSRGELFYRRPDYAIGGAPLLIAHGKIDIAWEREKTTKSFVETRHPRTAVAKLKDGKFLMITVDGRTEASGGMGLQDLAEYLLSLGAVDAMNLDGGGSTTMWVDGKVVNHPSDKEGERKVSDALLVTLRKKN